MRGGSGQVHSSQGSSNVHERTSAPLPHVSLAELLRAPVARNRSPTCDCSAPKRPQDDQCARCAYLDGPSRAPLQRLVIDALRGTDGLSIHELCKAVHGHFDASVQRSMLRVVLQLLANGRVRRYWVERNVEGSQWGRYSAQVGGAWWVYALDGRPGGGLT